jgi:hypothetical protein
MRVMSKPQIPSSNIDRITKRKHSGPPHNAV